MRKKTAHILPHICNMKTTKINGKDLLAAGYAEGKILGIALGLLDNHFKELEAATVINLFKDVKSNPEAFMDDPVLEELATKIIEHANGPADKTIVLKTNPSAYAVYGEANIDKGARDQMNIAMSLPVAVAGALMPDAHQGYGLPIGGVLATKGVVIPYGVGVDIGCAMTLSIFDIPGEHFNENHAKFKRELIAHTKFGAGQGFQHGYKSEHEVLDDPTFNITHFIRQLKDKAYAQLGTSGGGNHFVEWGTIEFEEKDTSLGIEKGNYVALLSHSGSRGMGATIAGYYTRLAKQLCKLPQKASNLAYLDLNSAEGQEYWLAMNLAGEYAAASHEVIHKKLANAIGGQKLITIANHHNFAWKEQWNGEEVIVHRKGATPAAKGVMGFIPGSMAAPGFLVRGKGAENALQSASHGAGRAMSRTAASNNITGTQLSDVLKENKVTLIGGGRDEAPMAYKDINMVMDAQRDLVDVVAKFTPRIVRMADDGSKED